MVGFQWRLEVVTNRAFKKVSWLLYPGVGYMLSVEISLGLECYFGDVDG